MLDVNNICYFVTEKFLNWGWENTGSEVEKFLQNPKPFGLKKCNLKHQSLSPQKHTPTHPPTSNQPKPQALFWLLIEFSQSAAIAQVMWVIDYKNLSHGHRFHMAQRRARESWCELNAALRISAI